jgi:hypothetical protein
VYIVHHTDLSERPVIFPSTRQSQLLSLLLTVAITQTHHHHHYHHHHHHHSPPPPLLLTTACAIPVIRLRGRLSLYSFLLIDTVLSTITARPFPHAFSTL